jgi:hypothetical protein
MDYLNNWFVLPGFYEEINRRYARTVNEVNISIDGVSGTDGALDIYTAEKPNNMPINQTDAEANWISKITWRENFN